MKKLFFYGIYYIVSLAVAGQQSEITISGEYSNAPFAEVVESMEKAANLTFYFSENLVGSLKVNITETDIPLDTLLNHILTPCDLKFYREDRNIYIYPGKLIVTEIPAYHLYSQSEATYTQSRDSITDIERKYLEGRIIAATQVITVGNRQKNQAGIKCIVNGKIVDEANGEPLIGATVYLEDLKTGVVSDIDGQFKLVLLPGKYKMFVNYMSMKQLEKYLQVFSGGSIILEMKKKLVEIDEAKVTADLYDNVRGMHMGYNRISTKTIREIPVVMGERDIMKVVQMLPGVQSVGEGSQGINVRGSSTDENMFYLNKVPVYNTSHLFGFFSSFNPDIINDFTLYKSNIPVRYGGRIASVFDISTRQGSKKKFFGKGGISPVTAHCSFEVPAIKDKVSLVTSWRSSYSDWILKNVRNKDVRKSGAFFYDATFGIYADLNDKNLLKIFGYRSSDDFTLSSINDYNYSNTGGSINWKHIFSSTLVSDFSLAYSRYSYENSTKNNLSDAYTHNFEIDHYEARTDFCLINHSNHRIDFGADNIFYNLDRGRILSYGEASLRIPRDLGSQKGIEGAVYVSDEFSLFPALSLEGGIRYSYFIQPGPAEINKYDPENIHTVDHISEKQSFSSGEIVRFYSGPEYRIAVNWISGNENSIKTSYNRLYQYLYMLSNTIAISPDAQWQLCDYFIAPPECDQVSLGYYHNFSNKGIKASLEVYRKWIRNKVEYKDGVDFISDAPVETQVLQGDQKAWGLEVLVNKNAGKISGWASYCYSRSFIKIDGGLKETSVNMGRTYPSNYDMPHAFNLVMNYRANRRLSLSTNFIYATGRPITYPEAVYYSEGQELLYFSARNKYRIPDYVRMDISINLEGSLVKKKPLHSFWMVNLYNVLGRRNAYSVYYAAEKGKVKAYKLSIFALPIFTVSWNYKFGNYLNE